MPTHWLLFKLSASLSNLITLVSSELDGQIQSFSIGNLRLLIINFASVLPLRKPLKSLSLLEFHKILLAFLCHLKFFCNAQFFLARLLFVLFGDFSDLSRHLFPLLKLARGSLNLIRQHYTFTAKTVCFHVWLWKLLFILPTYLASRRQHPPYVGIQRQISFTNVRSASVKRLNSRSLLW